MNKLSLFLLGYIVFLSVDTYAQCNKDYQLYWSDEFDSTAVDTKKWVIKQGGGGFGNQEIQYYQPQNASVSDGLLHIKIAKETVVDGSETYNYTSAKLETASKVNFLYGKMEAKIKMPNAVGSWPAFWMLGSNIGNVGWPHCGEIDIMEWVGRGPDVASGSIFFDGNWPYNHITTAYTIPEGQSFITDFHTFAVEWEPNEIRYFCDGNKYATYKSASIAPKEWVYNHEFFLILNCAIGGTGGGGVVTIDSPQNMEVDYVRVYSLPSTADSIVLSGSKSLMENSQNVLYKTNYLPNTTYDWSLPEGATIVDGAGTNIVHVNFTTNGGKIKVTANNSCGSLSDSLTVNLRSEVCKMMYDNSEDTIDVSYSTTGILTEQFENPLQDFNRSELVNKYERNILETYDVLGINDIALGNALDYENKSKVFYMDILTNAPVGTQITLQLENNSLNVADYPQGRRSSYVATVSKQNEWHTLKFNFNVVINSTTPPDQIDHIALLFDPSHKTDYVLYFDNFRRQTISVDCGTLVNGILDSETGNLITVYPNPVSNTLFINVKDENLSYSIYNSLGEKVKEDKGNRIDVSRLSKGIYLFRTEGNTFTFVKE